MNSPPVTVDGAKFQIPLLLYNKDLLYEVVNTLTNKDFSNEMFSELDFVHFMQCTVHAKKTLRKRCM